VSFPIFLVWKRRASALTRHVIAASQMLMGGLLIQFTGGRIETHFFVFGSLAFIAFYRDWQVLLPAPLVVAVDHVARGLFWPQSVYGILTPTIWRSLEHAGWVIFIDIFLVVSIRRSIREMRETAGRQAELESMNAVIEKEVELRTQELRSSEE